MLVGTHKDELNDEDADLEQAQHHMTDFLNQLYLAKKEGLVSNIQQATDANGKTQWFFAVDNKSREITAEGKHIANDPAIEDIRVTLAKVVKADPRKVTGVYAFD